MLAVLDTTVFIDFMGDDPDRAHASRHVMTAAAEQKFDSAVALMSIQEVFHVSLRKTGSRSDALKISRWIGESFPVLDHLGGDLQDFFDVLGDQETLGGADAMILSAANRAGADFIVTRDKLFGATITDRWVDPTDPASLARLIEN
jgi:predicted nucleic acid-binding protein